MMLPETRYAKTGNIHVAHQVFGKGPMDIVLIPGLVSHIENYWDELNFARWLGGLASFSRIVMLDKRGTEQLAGLKEPKDRYMAME